MSDCAIPCRRGQSLLKGGPLITLLTAVVIMLTACQAESYSILPEETARDRNYETVPLGSFVNGSGVRDVLSDSNTIVSTSSITMLPYQGVTMKALLPDGYQVKSVSGITSALGTDNGWKNSMEDLSIPSDHLCYRLQFRKTDDSELQVDVVTRLAEIGAIVVMYDKIDLGVVERNYASEKYVKAACYRLGWEGDERYTYQGLNSMPMFAHISDVHGDSKRFENCVEYAHMVGVDAILGTGDGVLYQSEDGATYQADVLKKYPGTPFLTCIGNHEVYTVKDGRQGIVASADLFNRFISPYVEQGGYRSKATVPADNCYYYVDFPSRKIRIIVLNQYDNGCYWGSGLGGRLGQTQVNWFCDALISAPEGYGIMIAVHSPEDMIDTPYAWSAWNQTINVDGTNEDVYGYAADGLYVNASRPIETIVDAFIDRAALSTSYKENNRDGNNGETVVINADFGSVANDVEFICYLSGHRHKDNVGYLHRANNKQLVINIVCGNPYYARGGGLSFAGGCDLPRGDRGVTQDAFNIIAIDRQAGCVRVARVGSSVTFEGVERNLLIAEYRTKSLL